MQLAGKALLTPMFQSMATGESVEMGNLHRITGSTVPDPVKEVIRNSDSRRMLLWRRGEERR
jgi:hypothetical protein